MVFFPTETRLAVLKRDSALFALRCERCQRHALCQAGRAGQRNALHGFRTMVVPRCPYLEPWAEQDSSRFCC